MNFAHDDYKMGEMKTGNAMEDDKTLLAAQKPGSGAWPGQSLTAAQMRAVEAQAMESGAVTGLELMERAGAGVVQAIAAQWPEMQPGRALVLCGPGNNGGDGFVVARLLRARGWEVEVYLYGDPARLPPDARVNHDLWAGRVHPLRPETFEQQAFPGPCDLLVDALFGIGLRRPIDLPLLALTRDEALGQAHRIVSVDVPSGLCADSGREIGHEVVVADLTVSFHRLKPGHILAEGPALCGKLRLVDLGLAAPLLPFAMTGRSDEWILMPPGVAAQPQEACIRLAQPNVWALGKSVGHKFSHGHGLVLSGPAGACGAARMTARAALRVGAGLVTLGCPPEAMAENAARLDAVMLKAMAGAEALTALLCDPRINALCLGPGLGLDDRAAGLVRAALEASRPRVKPGAPQRPGLSLVLDADALTLISGDPGLFALLHAGCVLTPHGGEFARLFPDLSAKLAEPVLKGPAFSKVDALREAAARAGCTVLLKGPDTVIASPGGICAIHAAVYDRSAPWLATAGSGDVLAGLITGLLARGFPPQQAAETGAWLHVEAARAFGPGLIAEDLPDMIPQVFRDLGL